MPPLLDRRSGIMRLGYRLTARDRKAAAALRDAITMAGAENLISFLHAGYRGPDPCKQSADLAAWVLPLDAGLRV